jgi:hypothetical protein
MIPRNAPAGNDRDHQGQAKGAAAAMRRESLVSEMVKGAVLPRLLARKDEGAFDRGPNVVRFPHGDEG